MGSYLIYSHLLVYKVVVIPFKDRIIEEEEMNFKVVKGRYPFEIEEQLNKLGEDWNPVEPMCMTYDHNINQYTVIVRVGHEVLPCTTLSQMYQIHPKNNKKLDK